MFHFNTKTRVECYDHGVLDARVGYDGCYDCTAELGILHGYSRSVHNRNRHRQDQPPTEFSIGPGSQAANPPPAAAAAEEDAKSAEIADAGEPIQQDDAEAEPRESPDQQPPAKSAPADGCAQPDPRSAGTAAVEIPRTPWAELTPEDKELVLELGAQISLDLGRKWRSLCTPQPPPDHREFLNTFLRFGRNA